jgi:ribulose-5-phosphate 4-epimerase/fuculose-1-phosphate aldolase
MSEEFHNFEGFCKKIASLKLVQASSGNCSYRHPLSKDEFYITSTGCWFDSIEQQDIVKCSIRTKSKCDSMSLDPSSEVLIHSSIFEKRPEVNWILHYQPVHGTILACSKQELKSQDFYVIPEIPYYIKNISYVPYIKPGSKELSDIVVKRLETNELVIMKNHGLIVVGYTQEQILQRALFFELACEIIVKSRLDLDRIRF